MVDVLIEQVATDEVKALCEIVRQTFYESFSAQNSEDDMQKYLDENFSSKKMLTELNEPSSLFYFARKQEKVIGYLKLNFGQAQTEIQDSDSVEIERIYVLREFQRMGIGARLLDKAIEIAKSKNALYIWLGVWEENYNSILFYEKNGFTEFDKHIFRLGNDEQIDILMKLNLFND